ncbi:MULTISPECIES: hypothetical protein [unclassified Pseudoclavibacter]|uniref:hypothetical protein n=1 Tax=unclassified Pseudoclavibacter TaxID=2615177 RepID=UPI001BA4C445|nr:hypothetical protein [Pseudoclavibacter sp. Marseille-Q4354]MBS3180029.1 hypothetical protein [Pseudoclavibacter sp. Marseille-Q4354]
MTGIETAAEYIARLDDEHRSLCEARAAGTLPQAIIDQVDKLDPDFLWDRPAAEAALAASVGIVVTMADGGTGKAAPRFTLLRSGVVSDGALLLAFVETPPSVFSRALHRHIERQAGVQIVPLGADDEMRISLWLLFRARELVAAQGIAH